MRYFVVCAVMVIVAAPASAGVIFGSTGLVGGLRWDAAPRTISGVERSLNGGLRYSLQGGTFLSYRDQFTWQTGNTPSVPAFQLAVEKAFNAWTVPDPVSGITTSVRFTPDLGTATATGSSLGSEIDLLAGNIGSFTQGVTNFGGAGSTVTLTSGTTGYNSSAISGADITINNNTQAVYSLSLFQLLLTHEIGHALGLGDVDFPGSNAWIDDNYNPANSATALATLTNSWTHLVNTGNPAASSGLTALNPKPADGNPGVDTPGVNILMESNIPGELFGNDNPLSNDDYGTRQFLYPSTVVIPEPTGLVLLGAFAVGGAALRRKWRRKVS